MEKQLEVQKKSLNELQKQAFVDYQQKMKLDQKKAQERFYRQMKKVTEIPYSN